MNKKQLLVMIPLLVAVIGLMYYGIHGKSQPASVGNLVTKSVQPIDYSLPDDSGAIIYGAIPNDGGPVTFESRQ